MQRYSLLIALFILAFTASAQNFPSFTVHPGKIGPGGNPFDALSSASLCLSGTKTCFTLPHLGLDDPMFYDEAPEATRFISSTGEEFVLFDAHTAGGSGVAYSYALLHFQDGKLNNLLPRIETSNISDRALWNLPAISPVPVFLTADFIWEDGAHYGDHRYTITAYVYGANSRRYTKCLSFDTKARYPSADLSDKEVVQVLAAERKHIMQRLRTCIATEKLPNSAAER